MREVENIYKCMPFWSWNDVLQEKELLQQVEWMYNNGVGGFFMHARGGLKTEYLSDKWFNCVKVCSEKAKELGMEAYAYDENGWPSGFVGGKLLENIENHDRYLIHKIGLYDEKALVSYDITGEQLKRVTSYCENCLNIYEYYSMSTVDILNPQVVDQFLTLTHKEYKKRDTYSLKGFFTDEPQYYRWGTPYTKMLAPYFEEKYGQNILDDLGLLFVEKEGYRSFRYKYWKALQNLMLENFAKKVYTWCEENNYKLTGHYIEETSLISQMWCCGGIMPFYEFQHIPGIDYLGRWISNELAPKQVSSVAAQLGKKQVLTETYGCCGWDITPQELKEIAECQYVSGVNLMCQHLLPYTEHGQRKRDYPAHYSNINPWVRKNFKEFNDYFSILGKTLAESEEIVNVAVLHPMRSVYFDYKRFTDEQSDGVLAIEKSFIGLINNLTAKQIPHHYLDETILAKYGRVEGEKLIVGKCAYSFLILPKMYTMDKSTEKLLFEYINAGGRCLVADEKPEYIEGEKYNYNYLKSNVQWEEIIEAQPYTCAEDIGLRTVYRQSRDGKQFIYAVNLGEEKTIEFKLQKGISFDSYDILKDKYTTISTYVHFDKGQSYLLYISDKKPRIKKELKPLRLHDRFTVCGDPQNYLTLDFMRFSIDGKNYSEPLHHMGVFNEMLKRRYKGRLYLKYEFNVDKIPSNCMLFAENTNIEWVKFNQKTVAKCGCSDFEKSLYKYEINNLLKKGNNEIIICINYFQSEQVYHAFFGENITESLKNCLAYDTDIEPIYLKGNFGVYGEFEQGKNERILLGKNFYIGEQKKEVSGLIEEGYPFFSGDITLKQKIYVLNSNCELIVDKKFQLLDLKVNGRYVGRMMFGKRIDVSAFLKKGENEFEITLTVGNRNLLGAFHTLEQENMAIGPNTFERNGTWTNGKSNVFRENYAFIKTII